MEREGNTDCVSSESGSLSACVPCGTVEKEMGLFRPDCIVRSPVDLNIPVLATLLEYAEEMPKEVAERSDIRLIPNLDKLSSDGTTLLDYAKAKSFLDGDAFSDQDIIKKLDLEILSFLSFHIERDTIDPDLARAILHQMGYKPDLSVPEMAHITGAASYPKEQQSYSNGLVWRRARMSPLHLEKAKQVSPEFVDQVGYGRTYAYLVELLSGLGDKYDARFRGGQHITLDDIAETLISAGYYSEYEGGLTVLQQVDNLGLTGSLDVVLHARCGARSNQVVRPAILNCFRQPAPGEKNSLLEDAKQGLLSKCLLDHNRLPFWIEKGDNTAISVLKSLRRQLWDFCGCKTMSEFKEKYPTLENDDYEELWGTIYEGEETSWRHVAFFVSRVDEFWKQISGTESSIVIFSEDLTLDKLSMPYNVESVLIDVINLGEAGTDTWHNYVYCLRKDKVCGEVSHDAYKRVDSRHHPRVEDLYDDADLVVNLEELGDSVYALPQGETNYGVVSRTLVGGEDNIEAVEISALLNRYPNKLPAKVRYLYRDAVFDGVQFFAYEYKTPERVVSRNRTRDWPEYSHGGHWQDEPFDWKYIDYFHSMPDRVAKILQIEKLDEADREVVGRVVDNYNTLLQRAKDISDPRVKQLTSSIKPVIELIKKAFERRHECRHTYIEHKTSSYGGSGFGDWMSLVTRDGNWMRGRYFTMDIASNGSAVVLNPCYIAGNDMVSYPVSEVFIAFYPGICEYGEIQDKGNGLLDIVVNVDQSVFDISDDPDEERVNWFFHTQFDTVMPVFDFSPTDFMAHLGGLVEEYCTGQTRERQAGLNSAAGFIARPEIIDTLVKACSKCVKAEGGDVLQIPMGEIEYQMLTRIALAQLEGQVRRDSVQRAMKDTTQYYGDRIARENLDLWKHRDAMGERSGSSSIDVTIRITEDGLQIIVGNPDKLSYVSVGERLG